MLEDLIRISEDDAARRLFALRDEILAYNGQPRFTARYLENTSVLAVPFEDAQHFTPDTALSLEAACRQSGYTNGYVIPLFDAPECCYQITFSCAAFTALSDIDVIWLEFLVVEASQQFALLSGTLFNTLAGPLAFVESALGMTVEEGWREFLRDFVDEAYFEDSEKREFVELVAAYRQAAGR